MNRHMLRLLLAGMVAPAWAAAPVWTSAPVTNTCVGVPYVYSLGAADADGDPLTFGAAAKPAWCTLTQNTSGLSGSEPLVTVAGMGSSGTGGDGGPATNAQFLKPFSAAVDARGRIYISDHDANRVRRIGSDGIINVFAGNGSGSSSGDGGPATAASMFHPIGIAVDTGGNVYVTEMDGNRVRRIDTNGIISTVLGNGTPSSTGDGGPATNATVDRPIEVACDATGNVYVADMFGNRIRKIDVLGIVTRIAGTGVAGAAGLGGPATSAQLNQPYGLAVNSRGEVHIADYVNHRVVKIDTNGALVLVAGTGVAGFSGDGGPATLAQFNNPAELAIDGSDNLYVSDLQNHCVRKITTDGTITTVAGRGQQSGWSGEGGPATNALLNAPFGVVFDPEGRLLINDYSNLRLRRIEGLSGQRRLSGTPGAGDVGTTTVSLWVTDGSATVTQSFSLGVSVCPPDAPTGVSASNGTYTDRVVVAWSPSSGATGYRIYRAATSSVAAATLLVATTSTSHHDLTVALYTTYWYWVVATNAAGSSPYSAPAAGEALDAASEYVYVHPSGGHVAPFNTLAKAATNIQAAVQVADPGAIVLVHDGVYDSGGDGAGNRVNLSNGIRLRSVNGPEVTIIDGANSVRCAQLADGCLLEGFTLTRGAADSGGGAYLLGAAVLSNCVVAGNSSSFGGGVYGGVVYSSRIASNSAAFGGGVAYGQFFNCLISQNTCTGLEGGGAYMANLDYCTISNNTSRYGGGVARGRQNHCLIVGNLAYDRGGGAYNCEVRNCVILDNVCFEATAGLYGGTSYNTILYYNRANNSANWAETDKHIEFTLTEPIPYNETNNITGDPGLLGFANPRIASNSVCRDAGSSLWNLSTLDLDGEPRVYGAQMDIGMDEYQPGGQTGAVTAAIHAPYTLAVAGHALSFRAEISGRASAYRWDMGDGTIHASRLIVRHAWTNAGRYPVVLATWNDSGTAAATTYVDVVQSATNYVSLAGSHTPPFTSWTTAATNIQDAVDILPVGGVTLVATGTYSQGRRLVDGTYNRVAVLKTMSLIAQDSDPAKTVILGGAAGQPDESRCLYLGEAARLTGFTLTNGYAGNFGGGVFGSSAAIISNCVITGNEAYKGGGVFGVTVTDSRIIGNRAQYGAGTYFMTGRRLLYAFNGSGSSIGGGGFESWLESCLIVSNVAAQGGGMNQGTFHNCTFWGNSGGGVYDGRLYGCIVYGNSGSGSYSNVQASAHYLEMYNCLTAPYPTWATYATNVLVADPGFRDPAAGDFQLTANSPCRDAGVNMPWMDGQADLAGNPRILNGVADLGAFEAAQYVRGRVFLEGAYVAANHAMRTNLSVTGALPATPPYAADRQAAPAAATNIVDWVLVELRAASNAVPAASRSARLTADGYIVSGSGSPDVLVDVPTGSFHVAIKHRNHLAALSATPLTFTGGVTAFDFTLGPAQLSGGTNAAVQLEPGMWGLFAGDADGDGIVAPADGAIYSNQTGRSGYWRGDFNLDGQVTAADQTLWAARLNRTAVPPMAETRLEPALRNNPARATILAGESRVLQAGNAAGPVSWAMIQNASGASLAPLTATSALFTAGSSETAVDVVQAWDASNRLDRSFFNIISAADVSQAGKAIIVSGRKGATDPLWPVTDHLAHSAYLALRYRGYAKANLHYLSPIPGRDVDQDGFADEIQAETTFANVANSITNWARASNKLFLYLVDHGGDSSGAGYFRLSGSEILAAAQLDAWLDALQDAHGTEVTVLIDCCYAGSFLDELTYGGAAKRLVIASCGAAEPAYFVAGGLVSFSDSFFGGVMLGYDVDRAWAQARDAMAVYQTAGYYENATGLASNAYLGASFVIGKDAPHIGIVCGDQLLTDSTRAMLWVGDVNASYPIKKVWCLVVPPRHNPDPADPVADLPELELVYSEATGRYQALYDGFNQPGLYKLIYYARDTWDSVSAPRQSFVQQSAFREKVVLVAGGSTNDADWGAVDQIARNAYGTLLARWIDSTNIWYMSPAGPQDLDGDGLNDVDAAPSRSSLGFAITNWACVTNTGGAADRLSLILVGPGSNTVFTLNSAETVSPSDLDFWLARFQADTRSALVMLDFNGAGAFLPGLARTNRICIAAAKAGQPASRAREGLLSFTRHFMSYVFRGQSVASAFANSRRATRSSSGLQRQEAQLDDDGSGVANEKKKDGVVSLTRHLGAVFATGADAPEIGAVTPDALLTNVTGLLLWAGEVTSGAPITNVWCIVTPPDETNSLAWPQTNLAWNAGTRRFEAGFQGFSRTGTYVCSFYAADEKGEISSPVQMRVARGGDAFENDDTPLHAIGADIGDIHAHTHHHAQDEDWIKFYALGDVAYRVRAVQLWTNVDVALQVYVEEPDGSLADVSGPIDDFGTGAGEEEAFDLNPPPRAGVYYARAWVADPTASGAGSDYELFVEVLIGGGHLIVVAVDKLNPTQPPVGAKAIIDNVTTQVFTATSLALTGLSAGIHTVRVETAAGYHAEEDPATPGQVTNANSVLYGNPKKKQVVNDTWQSVVFQFVPMGRVGTNTVVRDGWTGEWVGGASFAFRAKNGTISNVVYDGYPNQAVYGTGWVSGVDGRAPGNVWLPTVNYDVTVSAAGYGTKTWVGGVTGLARGGVLELGELRLEPVDANGNGISDAWEAHYFGEGSNVNGNADADEDGVNNRGEYVAGTHPKDAGNVFEAGGAERGSAGLTLRWPVAPGRRYAVQRGELRATNAWPVVGGPWDAAAGQSMMEWTDPAPPAGTGRFYRIGVQPP